MFKYKSWNFFLELCNRIKRLSRLFVQRLENYRVFEKTIEILIEVQMNFFATSAMKIPAVCENQPPFNKIVVRSDIKPFNVLGLM